MRVSEALHLRLGDLRGDTLSIRQTKFQKSRQIPLHASTLAALARYIKKRRTIVAHTDHLFLGELSGRAVRALERCPRGRAAVERHMAALSAYLGHAHPRHTFWYLHRSPPLLRSIARLCERTAGGTAP